MCWRIISILSQVCHLDHSADLQLTYQPSGKDEPAWKSYIHGRTITTKHEPSVCYPLFQPLEIATQVFFSSRTLVQT